MHYLSRTPGRWAPYHIPKAQVFDIQHPKSTPLGHDTGDAMIIPFDKFNDVFVRTHTQFGTQIFELNFVVEI